MIAVIDAPAPTAIRIEPGPALDMPSHLKDYRQWLWGQMQREDDAGCDVWEVLYQIANLVWVGEYVQLDHPNAVVIMAAIDRVVLPLVKHP